MVLIIDYGMGNIGSVKRALEECGASEVVVSHYESDFDRCTHAILPGVGAFSDAMRNLNEHGLIKPIKKLALEDRVPFLGICLGMQLLATEGQEYEPTAGLDLIPGTVGLMQPQENERIPHVGWNEIRNLKPHPMLEGINEGSDFYFVHSYKVKPANEEHIIAQTPYADTVTSIIARDNIAGVQFHPEKSSFAGFQLIRNFLSY